MIEKIIRYGNSGTCRLNYDKENKEMAYFTFSGLERTESRNTFLRQGTAG